MTEQSIQETNRLCGFSMEADSRMCWRIHETEKRREIKTSEANWWAIVSLIVRKQSEL